RRQLWRPVDDLSADQRVVWPWSGASLGSAFPGIAAGLVSRHRGADVYRRSILFRADRLPVLASLLRREGLLDPSIGGICACSRVPALGGAHARTLMAANNGPFAGTTALAGHCDCSRCGSRVVFPDDRCSWRSATICRCARSPLVGCPRTTDDTL